MGGGRSNVDYLTSVAQLCLESCLASRFYLISRCSKGLALEVKVRPTPYQWQTCNVSEKICLYTGYCWGCSLRAARSSWKKIKAVPGKRSPADDGNAGDDAGAKRRRAKARGMHCLMPFENFVMSYRP